MLLSLGQYAPPDVIRRGETGGRESKGPFRGRLRLLASALKGILKAMLEAVRNGRKGTLELGVASLVYFLPTPCRTNLLLVPDPFRLHLS